MNSKNGFRKATKAQIKKCAHKLIFNGEFLKKHEFDLHYEKIENAEITGKIPKYDNK